MRDSCANRSVGLRLSVNSHSKCKPTIKQRVSQVVCDKLKAKRERELMDEISSMVNYEISIHKRTLDSKAQIRVNETIHKFKRNLPQQVEMDISKSLYKELAQANTVNPTSLNFDQLTNSASKPIGAMPASHRA